ncbi:hypothetical protein Asp14428_03500 [Actinoplanes sp. NBRC 14428]|nr:hypothetical protein Asp14428_03500 [Actinoplanes sp. NBRC 14428]
MLRLALREEAARHLPDRAVMLARVARGRARPARPALLRLRPLAAAGAVAVVLALSIAGVRLAGGGPDHAPVSGPAPGPPPGPPSAAPPVSPSAAPPVSPSVTPPGGREPRGSASSGATRRPPGTTDSFLSSQGAVDPGSHRGWSQANVTLRTGRIVSSLRVTVVVARTAGAAGAGRWSTVPATLLTSDVSERADRIVYRFVLREGVTLPAGTYVFAVQYSHATGGRSPAADTYAATAADGRTQAQVAGGF